MSSIFERDRRHCLERLEQSRPTDLLAFSGIMKVASARLSAKQQAGKTDVSLLRDRTFDLKQPATDDGSPPPTGAKAHAKSPALTLQLSDDKLQKQLPLKSGAIVRLPLMMHSPEVRI